MFNAIEKAENEEHENGKEPFLEAVKLPCHAMPCGLADRRVPVLPFCKFLKRNVSAMKEYTNPYNLISDCYGAVLDILTEEEKQYLDSVLDFECIVLRVHDGLVDITDSITEEIYNSQTVSAFIHDSVKFAFHDCEKDY